MKDQKKQEFEHAPGETPPDIVKDTGQIEDTVQDELNRHDGLKKIGASFYNLSKSGQKETKEYSLTPLTQVEKTDKERENLKSSLKIRPNRLKATSTLKVFWSYFGAFAAMLAEFFVFQSIAENVLGIDIIKSYFVALFAVVFTKFVQAIILPKIKEWVKENNTRLKSWFKTLLFLFVILILVNAVTIGINNILNIDRIEKLEYILFLQEEDPDSPELKQVFAEVQQNDNILYSVVRFCAIAFLGFLAIPCGALLWALGDLYYEALKLRKKIDTQRKELSRIRSNFQYLISTHADLLLLQKEIICLFGHKSYYEKLMSSAVKKGVQSDIEST